MWCFRNTQNVLGMYTELISLENYSVRDFSIRFDTNIFLPPKRAGSNGGTGSLHPQELSGLRSDANAAWSGESGSVWYSEPAMPGSVISTGNRENLFEFSTISTVWAHIFSRNDCFRFSHTWMFTICPPKFGSFSLKKINLYVVDILYVMAKSIIRNKIFEY